MTLKNQTKCDMKYKYEYPKKKIVSAFDCFEFSIQEERLYEIRKGCIESCNIGHKGDHLKNFRS